MQDIRLNRSQAATACIAGLIAAIVAVVLANPPAMDVLLFTGGWRSTIFGLSMLLLLPLIVSFQFAFGVAFARFCGADENAQPPWLIWLSGSAIVSLAGVIIGVAGGLNPFVCGTLFVLGVVYAFGPAQNDAKGLSTRLSRWLRLSDIDNQKTAFVVARIGIIFALIMIGLRAATGELNDTDFVQFYWSWFNEIRHLGSIRLTPEQPLIFAFSIGRGNGAYLMLAGLAPGLVAHVVSASYCIMFSVILRAFVLKAISFLGPRPDNLALLAADLAMLAALWMLPGSVSFGKYHIEFAVWVFGLLLASQFIVMDDGAWRRARLLLIPVVIALPVALAQIEALAVLVIGLAGLASKRWTKAFRLIPLIAIGAATAAFSLLANWLYLGIPDLYPFQFFERFIREAGFDFWTSRLQQDYINYIQAGAFTWSVDGSVGMRRSLVTLFHSVLSNSQPIFAGAACIGVATILAWRMRGVWGGLLSTAFGLVLGYGLFRIFLTVSVSGLAASSLINQIVIYAAIIVCFFLVVCRRDVRRSGLNFAFALLGYWLICRGFVLLFHSGSMDRLMRHADPVAAALVLVTIIYAKERLLRLSVPAHSVVTLLVASAFAVTCYGGFRAASIDPPGRLLGSTFGVSGRAAGLTNPLSNLSRCREIAHSVPADARVLFLNAYTAMAGCNNAVLLPRTMIVHQHESDFARDLATSAFAGPDEVEHTLRKLRIDYFLVLKGDSEFWASGLSAPFRPRELERRFDLVTETPAFYVLGWRGTASTIPAKVAASITEWRRIGIQQHGFIANNEFVSQWRAMANLGADRPKYNFGTVLDFTANGWSALYADHGWYAAEPTGTWTLGPRAIVTLPFAQSANGPIEVTLTFTPFLVPQLPNRKVRLLANGHEVADWSFKLGDGLQVKSVELSADLVRGQQSVVFDFEISNSISPYALGISPDWRPVGIMLRRLVVKEKP